MKDEPAVGVSTVGWRNPPRSFPFKLIMYWPRNTVGRQVEDNLALACPHCNRYKGANIAGFEAGQVVRLFHPRKDRWEDHFRAEREFILGITQVGRVTVQVLAMNRPDRLLIRAELLEDGLWP